LVANLSGATFRSDIETSRRRLSLLILVLAALPPSMLPEGALGDLLAPRRRQVALVGIAISLSAAIVVGIVFWAL
jgi:hypothetical protein